MMGGNIWVESEQGKGSKFSFTFKSHIKMEDNKLESGVSLEGKIAMNFVCVQSGREAVELFAADSDKYDAILMDINMPDMDGVEATRRIRALGTHGMRVPIIAVTANTSHDEVKGYLSAGMTDHVGKPIDNGVILRKIKKHIGNLNL